MAVSERVVAESPDRESASRADEYTRNFLQAEALPTIWQEFAFHRRFLPEITLNEINALSGDWFPPQNRLIVISAPETEKTALPNATQRDAVVAAAAAKRLTPYVDSAADLAGRLRSGTVEDSLGDVQAIITVVLLLFALWSAVPAIV